MLAKGKEESMSKYNIFCKFTPFSVHPNMFVHPLLYLKHAHKCILRNTPSTQRCAVWEYGIFHLKMAKEEEEGGKVWKQTKWGDKWKCRERGWGYVSLKAGTDSKGRRTSHEQDRNEGSTNQDENQKNKIKIEWKSWISHQRWSSNFATSCFVVLVS